MEVAASRQAQADDPASARDLLAANPRSGARPGTTRCRAGEEGETNDEAGPANRLKQIRCRQSMWLDGAPSQENRVDTDSLSSGFITRVFRLTLPQPADPGVRVQQVGH